MKFTVSSSKLFNQLQAVSKVVVPKNSTKILESVLFDLQDSKLTLTASDSETTIRTSIEVENVEGGGKVAFAAKLLIDTLKEFPEQPLTFDIDDQSFGMNITSDNGTYSFVGVNGNEYPEMTLETENASTFVMPSQMLLDSINKTVFCTADDELRPVMNGIYFDLKENYLALVATDAHRLVRLKHFDITSEQPISFILPKKPAALLRTVLARETDDVTIVRGEKNVCFSFGQTIVQCLQIVGRYPNYDAVIPQNNPNKVVVDRQTIVNACKRAAVFANSSTSLIKLSLSENTIRISSQDIDFSTSADETIACSYEGAPMAVGFKAPFLIEILSAVASSDVVLELADPARAGLILPAENAEGEELLMLLMPMLLND